METVVERAAQPARRKRFSGRIIAVLISFLVMIPVSVGLGFSPAAGSGTQLTMPRDEGPHNATHEWWYFTGHLSGKDPSGVTHEYGFEITFFRAGVVFPFGSGYTAHVAVTDLNRGEFHFSQRYDYHADYLVPGGGFANNVFEWVMAGKNGKNSFLAGISDYLMNMQLDSKAADPVAEHGNGGVIPYGPFGSSYYYSEPNLGISGTMTDHGVKIPVTGQGWFDHQWGNFGHGTVGGWDWYSIQLTNGQQYMLYYIKNSSGAIVKTIGTLINADGSSTDLSETQLSKSDLGTWTSPHTGKTYSSGWKVNVPGGSMTVQPRLKDQELYGVVAPTGSYWEGASTVTGTINGQAVSGKGYTEITQPGAMP